MDNANFLFPFGKHKGKTLEQIFQSDRNYLEWCVKNFNNKPDLVNKITSYMMIAPSGATASDTLATQISDTCPTSSRDYGIKYGELLNFNDYSIKKVLTMCNVSSSTIDYIIRMRTSGGNLNLDLYNLAVTYYQNRDTFFAQETNTELIYDLKKIFAAWLYGIVGVPIKSTTTKDEALLFQYTAVDRLASDDTISTVKLQFNYDAVDTVAATAFLLTRKIDREQKAMGEPNLRRVCKGTPYLFTPGVVQFLLLGIDGSQMNKIYKCTRDNIMSTEKGGFPTKYVSYGGLYYRIDWMSDYFAFLMNPYAYYSITQNTADDVIRNSNRNVATFAYEKYLGTITRFIYDKTKNFKWTATPKWCLTKEHPTVDDHLKILVGNYGLTIDLNYFYLKRIYDEEVKVASFVRKQLTLEARNTEDILIDDSVDGIELTEEQSNALKHSLSRALSVITGLAGTGKTTVIKGLIRYLLHKQEKFIVCAFTAKAKNRALDVIGNEHEDKVKTIHATINYLQNVKDEKLMFPKFIIIDEATMVSLSLLTRLVSFFSKETTNVILLGDVNQLPPIKYGRPFEDIVNSGNVHVSRLTKILRVKGGATDPIIVNSTDIVKSENYTISQAPTFALITYDNIPVLMDQIIRVNNITRKNVHDFKFITSTNDDAILINSEIAPRVNPPADVTESQLMMTTLNKKDVNGNKIKVMMRYTVGDPVIFTKNRVYRGASNGTEGIVSGFTGKAMTVDVRTGEGTITVNVPIHEWDGGASVYYVLLAYAVTVHKAQGSEWTNEYFYINGVPSKGFLNKRLVYTAITRAKDACHVIETKGGLYEAAARTPISIHYGGLQERIGTISNTTIVNSNPVEDITALMGNVALGSELMLC